MDTYVYMKSLICWVASWQVTFGDINLGYFTAFDLVYCDEFDYF